ncbi:MAG: 4-hydroxy-tetrahydrodipicolinate reductase [Woeseia sp.]
MAVDVKTVKIAVLGAGRMGQEIMRSIASDRELLLAGVWTRKDISAEGGDIVISDELEPVLVAADVAIDFSLPEATPKVLDAVRAAGIPLVIGVSGLDDAASGKIADVATSVPVLYDRNMSLGIAVLDRLVRQAAASLADGFEAEIHETHHAHKIDAPSGTALQLGASLAAARNQDFDAVRHYEPAGLKRPLAPGEIGFEVTREGEVPGEHTVILFSESERLELKHTVSSRRVFADGALRAAKWLSVQPPGLYRMRNLLFPTETWK